MPPRRTAGCTWGRPAPCRPWPRSAGAGPAVRRRPVLLLAGDAHRLVVAVDGQRMAALQLVLAKADGHQRTVAVVAGQVDQQRIGSAGLADGRQGQQAKEQTGGNRRSAFQGVPLGVSPVILRCNDFAQRFCVLLAPVAGQGVGISQKARPQTFARGLVQYW